MDREILFRGQTRRRGEKVNMAGKPIEGNWVYGGIFQGTGDFSIIYGSADPDSITGSNLEKHVVYTDTVSQYTGLTDKYGTRIFEGDIVSVKNDQGEIYRFIMAFGECGDIQNIKRTVGYMGFHFLSGNDETNKCMEIGVRNDPLYWLNAYDCEVIGNRWDNPELMGGEQNE